MYAKSTSPKRPSVRGRPGLIEADIASLALNASITDVATQCLRKNAFFSTAPQGADQLKADYTLALARDYCAANEPEKCDTLRGRSAPGGTGLGQEGRFGIGVGRRPLCREVFRGRCHTRGISEQCGPRLANGGH